jgi:hypothetical protein
MGYDGLDKSAAASRWCGSACLNLSRAAALLLVLFFIIRGTTTLWDWEAHPSGLLLWLRCAPLCVRANARFVSEAKEELRWPNDRRPVRPPTTTEAAVGQE